jgi:5-methylcytosine-specific restriction enzyme A
MPFAPKRPCTYPGCAALSSSSRCDEHSVDRHRQYDKHKRDKNAKSFYNSDVWKRARDAKRARDPLCEDCQANGLIVPMHQVHHVDGDIWNLAEENLRSLCASCHSRLETTKRGGFATREGVGGGSNL